MCTKVGERRLTCCLVCVLLLAGRWDVRCTLDGSEISVKTANLQREEQEREREREDQERRKWAES